MHLKQVFGDFGPPHSTWCFAFEYYNGILGSFHTKKRQIESQLMRKFVHKQAIHRVDMTQCTDLSSILPPRIQSMHMTDSIRSDSLHLFHLSRSTLDAISSFKFVKYVGIDLLSPFYNDVFTCDVSEQVENIYRQLNLQRDIDFVLHFYRKFGPLTIDDDLIGSNMPGTNSHSSLFIMAYWPNRGSELTSIDYSRCKLVSSSTSFVILCRTLKAMKEKKTTYLLMLSGSSVIYIEIVWCISYRLYSFI